MCDTAVIINKGDDGADDEERGELSTHTRVEKLRIGEKLWDAGSCIVNKCDDAAGTVCALLFKGFANNFAEFR